MKAADVCVLPYVYIYQTGVLILSYRYGLPAVVTDAGSMRDDVIEGRTGFMCRPRDAADLARALTTYFSSQLFADGEAARHDIVTFAEDKYSWKAIATTVAEVYETVHPARQETARAAG
jgi:glycosyltransferase involved in cell wall biosynthesis